MTEQDVINLKRTIYLTIMSSAGFEECTHKLMKLDLKVIILWVGGCVG